MVTRLTQPRDDAERERCEREMNVTTQRPSSPAPLPTPTLASRFPAGGSFNGRAGPIMGGRDSRGWEDVLLERGDERDLMCVA